MTASDRYEIEFEICHIPRNDLVINQCHNCHQFIVKWSECGFVQHIITNSLQCATTSGTLVLISVKLALSQTPANTARPWTAAEHTTLWTVPNYTVCVCVDYLPSHYMITAQLGVEPEIAAATHDNSANKTLTQFISCQCVRPWQHETGDHSTCRGS